jgi:hypothetical protein
MGYSGSATDRLAAVRAAIEQALEAQKLSTTNGTVERALLVTLFAKEKELQNEAELESGGGSMCSLGFQTRPR